MDINEEIAKKFLKGGVNYKTLRHSKNSVGI